MLVYGWSTKLLKAKANQKAAPCDRCQNHSVITRISYSYAHLYYIPFFPMKQRVYGECQSCGAVYEQFTHNEPLKKLVEDARQRTIPPVWMFSFLILIVLGIIIAAMAA
jgi:hypothetical protein